MRTTRRALTTALVAAAGASGALAGPAQADPYRVDVCRHADQQAAPSDGWVPANVGHWTYYGPACGGGGKLHLSLDPTVGHADGNAATWTFTAPADTVVAGLVAQRDT